MGRQLNFDFRRGGGGADEILYGTVTLEPTAMHTVGGSTVLPAPTDAPLVNGLASVPDVAVSPDGPLPEWCYRVRVSERNGRGWSWLVGVPAGSGPVNFKDLPKFDEVSPAQRPTVHGLAEIAVAAQESAAISEARAVSSEAAARDAANLVNAPAGTVVRSTVESDLDTPGSGIATRISATIVSGVDASTRRVNALNAGAVNDPLVDSSPAIQAAIDAVAAEIVSSQMTTSRTVVFPGGRYRLNSQIVQPPYVKVQFEGSTILETYVEGKSAWWVTPLASDPTNLVPGSLQKQQWLWGPIFSGNAGAVVFVNKAAKAGSIALEIGVKSDIGALNPMSRYSLNDVAIQGYGVGVKWNSNRNYICSFHRFHIEGNDTAVQYGNGSATVDAGEKVNWYDSLFASCGAGFPAHHIRTDTVSIQLFGCSIDFVTDAFKVDAGAGYQSIDMFGGHLEGINHSNLYVPGRHGIVVSDITNNYLRVGLHAVPFVTYQRVTQFHGKMRLSLDMDYRSVDTTGGTVASLCDSEVTVTSLNLDRHGQGTRVSESLNVARDSAFASDPIGPVTSLTHWGMNLTNATAEIVEYGAKKAIKLSVAAGGYMTIFPKSRSQIRAGERVRLMMSGYKPSLGANFTGHVRFYDSAGTEISRSSDSTFTMPAGKVETWMDPLADVTAQAPSGAVAFAPYFTASSSAAMTGIMAAAPSAIVG